MEFWVTIIAFALVIILLFVFVLRNVNRRQKDLENQLISIQKIRLKLEEREEERLRNLDKEKNIGRYNGTFSQYRYPEDYELVKMIEAHNNLVKKMDKSLAQKALNFILLHPITRAVQKALSNLDNAEKLKDFYIIHDIAKVKTKSYYLSSIFVCLSLVIYSLYSYIGHSEIDYIIVCVIFLLLGLLYLNQKIFEYRVAKGFFGTNESESRQIVNYIVKTQNSYTNNSSGGYKVHPIRIESGELLQGISSGNKVGVPT